MRAEVFFDEGNERYDHRPEDGMNDATNEPRLNSTGKSAKKRRQGVLTGDEETSDEEDDEDDLHGCRMTADFYVKRSDLV